MIKTRVTAADENSHTIEVEIVESPYGDTGAVYKGALGMINHFVLQLKSFRRAEVSEHLEADIRGYEALLKSGSEKNAQEFMRLKTNARLEQGPDFENNEAVINYMKEQGTWHE